MVDKVRRVGEATLRHVAKAVIGLIIAGILGISLLLLFVSNAFGAK